MACSGISVRDRWARRLPNLWQPAAITQSCHPLPSCPHAVALFPKQSSHTQSTTNDTLGSPVAETTPPGCDNRCDKYWQSTCDVVVLLGSKMVCDVVLLSIAVYYPCPEPQPLDNLFRACSRRCRCPENRSMGNMDKEGPHGPFQGSVALFVVTQSSCQTCLSCQTDIHEARFIALYFSVRQHGCTKPIENC